MKRYRTITVSLFIIILGVGGSFAEEAKEEFSLEATVILADGTKSELSDFAFCSGYRDYSNPRHKITNPTDNILYLAQGNSCLDLNGIWKVCNLFDIEKLDCKPCLHENGGQDSNFVTAEILLTSGDIIKGFLPIETRYTTWFVVGKFVFGGKRTILGREGDFKIYIEELSSFAKDKDKQNSYIIKNTKGNIMNITKPCFSIEVQSRGWNIYSGTFGDDPRYIYDYKDGKLNIAVDENTIVPIKIKEIDILTFPVFCIGSSGKYNIDSIGLKSGEKASGKINIKEGDYLLIYGKTRSGEIWFSGLTKAKEDKEYYILKSIKFK